MNKQINEYMDKSTEFWKLKSKTLFHNAISLLTSQKIRFSESRKIIKKLYELNENKEQYCPKIFSNLTFDNFKNCGLEENIINCMFNVIELEKK
jgi:3-methyladenine DNA glycosylase/8-oxoguanine DNA glycosylase